MNWDPMEDHKNACEILENTSNNHEKARNNHIAGYKKVRQSSEKTKMIRPEPLCKGDRVALVAPSFYTEKEKLSEAIRSVEFLGLEPVIFPSCRSREDYLAGSDRLRAGDLMAAFSDPFIRGIFCLRGGYGAARILDLLDYNLIRQNLKIFAGFSDVTALHTAIGQKCGLITFHSPMPASPYDLLDEEISLSSLRRALFSEEDVWRVPFAELKMTGEGGKRKNEKDTDKEEKMEAAPRQSAGARQIYMSGRLCGGNLTVLAAALGTPYAVETADRILFLEDVGERTYRIDRAISSLRLAGRLQPCSGILLGAFEDCAAEPSGRDSLQIIRDIISPLHVPILAGLPAGHSLPNMTLPLGAFLEVDDKGLTFYLE